MTPKTTPKDFFLHLGATVALYASAAALINLSFSVINYYFPDVLAGYFYGNSVVWPISILIVLVPILYILEWLINRDAVKMPEKNELWIRKWRIYLTLFLVVILIGGDLIALINTYLNGEITMRFVYKIIVILLIGGVIGKYYFFSLYSNFKWAKTARRLNFWFGIILTLAAIVAGFIAVGSPAKQRALRFDSQRVNDLSSIQWQVVNYWQAKQKLPAMLADLKDPISGYVVPNDPETKAPYEYSVKEISVTSPATNTSKTLATNSSTKTTAGGLSFELCATFSEMSQDNAGRGSYYGGGMSYPTVAYDSSYPIMKGGDVWTHGKGRVCFGRTIDPDKYKLQNAKKLF